MITCQMIYASSGVTFLFSFLFFFFFIQAMSQIPPHRINNPHFEQPPQSPINPTLYPKPPYISQNTYASMPQNTVPNYSPPLMTMPLAQPVMPQAPYYGALQPPIERPPQLGVPSDMTIQSVDSLTTKPAVVECQHCRQLVLTVVDYDVGLLTGLSMVGLYMLGCHSGGCLIPYLFPWTKDVVHSCPACKEKIATFTRLERDTHVHATYDRQ
ncbi:hypothetical protein RMCBS344292_07694 [Rhizopus microsporus]|nr:hypothetical protein RMCBS344292_07694 [Rhizopus microsporus]